MKIINGTPVSTEKSISEFSTSANLTLGKLKRFLESNEIKNLPDDIPILIPRMSDSYFYNSEENGWKCFKVFQEKTQYSKTTVKLLEKIIKGYDPTLNEIITNGNKSYLMAYTDALTVFNLRKTYIKGQEDKSVIILDPHY